MANVSVIIPAYNAAATLARAVESALSQSCSPFEVIVVNDGSEDESLEIAKRFGPKVKVVDTVHQGVSAARNHGINISSGDWVAFLDADDVWRPEKLAIQLARSEEYPGAMLIATGAEYERDGTIYKVTRSGRVGRLVRDLLLDNIINTSTVMVRREALESPPVRFAAGVGFGEDWELWIKLASAHELLLIPDVLVRTLRASTNSSAGVDANTFARAMESTYGRLRRVPELEAVIADMWPTLSANIEFKKANFLYDRGSVRQARRILLREILRRQRSPGIAQSLKVLIVPRRLRTGINRVLARVSRTRDSFSLTLR